MNTIFDLPIGFSSLLDHLPIGIFFPTHNSRGNRKLRAAKARMSLSGDIDTSDDPLQTARALKAQVSLRPIETDPLFWYSPSQSRPMQNRPSLLLGQIAAAEKGLAKAATPTACNGLNVPLPGARIKWGYVSATPREGAHRC